MKESDEPAEDDKTELRKSIKKEKLAQANGSTDSKIERLLVRSVVGGIDKVLVKWSARPYSESSWEETTPAYEKLWTEQGEPAVAAGDTVLSKHEPANKFCRQCHLHLSTEPFLTCEGDMCDHGEE